MLTGMWKVTAKKNLEEPTKRLIDAINWELINLNPPEAYAVLINLENHCRKLRGLKVEIP